MSIFRSGPSARTRRQHAPYSKYIDKTDKSSCPFCTPKGPPLPINTELGLKYFRIIPNEFSYSIWDDCRVLEHYLVIPIRHVFQIDELPDRAKKEFSKIIGHFEKLGYSFYGRGSGSATRTVGHQHTHLITLANKRLNFIFYLKRPHLLLFK